MYDQFRRETSFSYSYNSWVNVDMDQMGILERIEKIASENAVVIFSMSKCCMCHAIKRLFCGLGVNSAVHELDTDPTGNQMEKALLLASSSCSVPVVFIGGKLVGSIDTVIASHINGSLVPLLKDAGALWL